MYPFSPNPLPLYPGRHITLFKKSIYFTVPGLSYRTQDLWSLLWNVGSSSLPSDGNQVSCVVNAVLSYWTACDQSVINQGFLWHLLGVDYFSGVAHRTQENVGLLSITWLYNKGHRGTNRWKTYRGQGMREASTSTVHHFGSSLNPDLWDFCGDIITYDRSTTPWRIWKHRGSSESSREKFFYLTVLSPYTNSHRVNLAVERKLYSCHVKNDEGRKKTIT